VNAAARCALAALAGLIWLQVQDDWDGRSVDAGDYLRVEQSVVWSIIEHGPINYAAGDPWVTEVPPRSSPQ
jgi:hypothetical protein